MRDGRGVKMVDNVSLDVRAGEIVGIAGVAGNGQSQLLEAIAGIRRAEAGEVTLDGQPVHVTGHADPALLRADAATVVEETLYSDLFKSNCPVTGQPDWGTVVLRYHGPRIDHAGLLRYLISFRDHEGFHEDCTEQIFCDLMARCRPINLGITLHFLRRGGLEIVPVRSTEPALLDFPAARLIRQ